ncbi:MAG: polysulfide reductase NrfD [Acidobacteria bacterium]|nr:polysulfide reductase NrfD [Acidobacteriota bacterium]MBU1337504.1 polysulfide reductase NrfD [Acidobacteriota bacterium]MBU4202853.1 polysulfide reductase NrfD [Acidobacteriota bacterium]MBU4254866.1 polysulfide reductase NrfD [Acidobacteriota bacterium]MBU4331030.1 polysulfide reductase NrfD [Acidobacteriota bacterium]
MLDQIQGYIYPNEVELYWRVLIVIYPYITGLVAGAFILASLVKVFNVKELQPTYRLSMLTALAFLIVAPMPLLFHLGHPERAFEIFLTPNRSSAMAMFGYVYIWYLMAVLLLEIWFDYRKDLILWSQQGKGLKKWIQKLITLFSKDISEKALKFDKAAVKVITIIGIPSAFLLHGYVGFIFGSIKANPWWSSVLMPIVFLFSAMVSGMALVLLLYQILMLSRRKEISMPTLDKLADYLFYTMIVAFSLEALDFIHRIYESEESIKIVSQLISGKLFVSLVVIQLLLGMLIPLFTFASIKLFRFPAELRKLLYFVAALLVQVGIFTTRWNVVIGGQLFSKSFRGLTTYKMSIGGTEGLLVALMFLILPFIILYFLIKILPPWKESGTP